VDEAEDEDGGHVQGQRDEEHEEIPVISPTYTVVDPRAVVVKDFDTVVTHRAVAAARGSVELTRDAPFHSHRDALYFHVPVERGPEVVVPVLVWTRPWYRAWIHEGCHRKIYEHKKRKNSLKYWNWIPVLNQDVPFHAREGEE